MQKKPLTAEEKKRFRLSGDVISAALDCGIDVPSAIHVSMLEDGRSVVLAGFKTQASVRIFNDYLASPSCSPALHGITVTARQMGVANIHNFSAHKLEA